MNRQKHILTALHGVGLAVCLFLIVFLLYIERPHHVLYFAGGAVVFALGVLLTTSNRLKIATYLFIFTANALLFIFDAGYKDPTAGFVFYFPVLFSNYILTQRKEWKERTLLISVSLCCILITNFTSVSPAYGKLVPDKDTAHVIALFNIITALTICVFIVRTYVGAIDETTKQIEQDKSIIQQSEQLLNSINRNIDEGICRTYALNNRIVYANRAYVKMFGYQSEEDILDAFPDTFYANPADRFEIILQLESTNEIKNREVTYIRKDGSKFIGLLTSTRQVDSEGRVYYDGAIRDITALKQIEKELIEAKEQAEKMSLEKGRFLTTMSHEIRTPMNAVIAISNILVHEDPKPSQMDNLGLLKYSAENLMNLLNNILDYSRIEAGMADLDITPVDLEELVKKAVKMQEPQTFLKDIELVCETKLTHKNYLADPTRLSQVLTNLLSNAIKFTEVGLVKVTLEELSSGRHKANLRIAVSDTGCGIEKDRLDKIFDSFTQEDSSVTRKYGGSGLGLAISKKIIRLMDSDIEVVSEKGKGSTFSFTLSLPFADRELAEEPPVGFLPEDIKGLRVLLVEDNISSIAVAKKHLEYWNLNFVVADSGKKAIEMLKNDKFDVVLMDLHMPELSGFDTTTQIRSFSNVPIVALTADVFTESKNKAMAAGMNDYIIKPFKSQELLDKLAQYHCKSAKS